jgi:hypothetical protein
MKHFYEAMMQNLPPKEMTEAQRDQEIASIFARGILRLRQQRRRTNPSSEERPKTAANSLEFPGHSRLSGTTG